MDMVMRGWLILLLILPIAASHAAEKNHYPIEPPEVVKINEHVYALLGLIEQPTRFNQGYISNSTAIIGKTGVILIDTGYSDEIGEHLKKAIAEITSKPVTTVINTHHHGDHVLGNIAFEGATIISSEKCRKLLQETGPDSIANLEDATQRKFPKTRPVLASVTFAEGTRTERVIDGVRLMLWVPKGSHSPGDMMVYLPDEKVLISGDIMVKHVTPDFEDANVRNWVETLKQIVELDPETVVPGHGLILDRADVFAMQSRMSTLYTAVVDGYRKGLSDYEIRKTIDLREWDKMHLFTELMGHNINHTYLEVEKENF